jgi:hypothetical protein
VLRARERASAAEKGDTIMRLQNFIYGAVVVAAWSFGCATSDTGVDSVSHGDGTGTGTGTGTSTGNGADAGTGGGGGSGGSSSGGLVSPSNDAGGTTSPGSKDAGGGGKGGTDAGTGPVTSDDAGSPSTTPDSSAPTDGFDQFQHHNLDDINKYRATLNIAPLVLDQELCTFAQAGSVELSQDHMAHQHFINASNDGSLWTSGFNSTAAENQGDPNGWTKLASDPTQNELQQIDAIQLAMFDEGPGTGEAHGHYTNMMDATSTRLGVGLLEVNGELYLTNDFSQ